MENNSFTGVNQTINVKAESTDKLNGLIGQARGFLHDVATAGFLKILKVFLALLFAIILFFICYIGYNVAKDAQNVTKLLNKIEKSEKEELANQLIRDKVTPQIQNELKSLLYSLDCDRTCIFELHNGKENTTMLPFRYADMTYEEINHERSVSYVSQHFQNLGLSHYQIPFYIVEHGMFVGPTEDIRDIDDRFAKYVTDTGGTYFGSVVLKNNGVVIGFLAIFYDNKNTIKSNAEIIEKISKYGNKLSVLLDLGAQKENDDEF